MGGSRDRTPLHYASAAGHVGVARILKEANADLTIKDKDGYTAINLTKGGEMCELLHQVMFTGTHTTGVPPAKYLLCH